MLCGVFHTGTYLLYPSCVRIECTLYSVDIVTTSYSSPGRMKIEVGGTRRRGFPAVDLKFIFVAKSRRNTEPYTPPTFMSVF